MVGGGRCRQTPVWSPANARIRPDAVSLLAHRQRRWTNIETTLGQVFVFAGRAVHIYTRAVCVWLEQAAQCSVYYITCFIDCIAK